MYNCILTSKIDQQLFMTKHINITKIYIYQNILHPYIKTQHTIMVYKPISPLNISNFLPEILPVATIKITFEPEHQIHYKHQHKNAAITTSKLLLGHIFNDFYFPRVDTLQLRPDVVKSNILKPLREDDFKWLELTEICFDVVKDNQRVVNSYPLRAKVRSGQCPMIAAQIHKDKCLDTKNIKLSYFVHLNSVKKYSPQD